MSLAPDLDLDALLDDRDTRIIVCCGSGGVGKTTTAAAFALRAAERGRDVVVLTIDPARRLAQSLGLTELDNTPRPVEGIDTTAGGRLQAMMLDMKRTFDDIVLEHADDGRAEQILSNPFYQSLSASFAGTQEYMAMEKLGQLHALGEWDLIVVDTPPSRSALDFLDAPNRLGSFLDGKFIKILTAPAKVGGFGAFKLLTSGFSLVTGALGKLLGSGLLADVQSFVNALDTMFGGFRERAEATFLRPASGRGEDAAGGPGAQSGASASRGSDRGALTGRGGTVGRAESDLGPVPGRGFAAAARGTRGVEPARGALRRALRGQPSGNRNAAAARASRGRARPRRSSRGHGSGSVGGLSSSASLWR